jgi:glycosyltransferase involved in cell wall biosynthesis
MIPLPIELVLVMDGDDHHNRKEDVKQITISIPNFKLIEYTANKGKGFAIRQGAAAATGDIIIYTDIDFPYSNESVQSIFTTLTDEGYDVAVGVKNEDYYKLVPPMRRSISKGLRLLIRVFLSMPVTDTQCGLKGFRKEIKQLFLQTTINRYLFDLEFVRNCFRLKPPIKLKAVPVQLKTGVHFRNMNYRILLPEMLNFIKLLFKKTV